MPTFNPLDYGTPVESSFDPLNYGVPIEEIEKKEDKSFTERVNDPTRLSRLKGFADEQKARMDSFKPEETGGGGRALLALIGGMKAFPVAGAAGALRGAVEGGAEALETGSFSKGVEKGLQGAGETVTEIMEAPIKASGITDTKSVDDWGLAELPAHSEDLRLLQEVTKPIEWVQNASKFYGDWAMKAAGSSDQAPEVGATVASATEAIALLGLPALARTLGKSNTFRMLTNRERGLVVQSFDSMRRAGHSPETIYKAMKTIKTQKEFNEFMSGSGFEGSKVIKGKATTTEKPVIKPAELELLAEEVPELEFKPEKGVAVGEDFVAKEPKTTKLRKAYPQGKDFVTSKDQDVAVEYKPIGKKSKGKEVVPFRMKHYADKKLIELTDKNPGTSYDVKPYKGGFVVQRRVVEPDEVKKAKVVLEKESKSPLRNMELVQKDAGPPTYDKVYRPAVKLKDGTIAYSDVGVHITALEKYFKDNNISPEEFNYNNIVTSGGLDSKGNYYELKSEKADIPKTSAGYYDAITDGEGIVPGKTPYYSTEAVKQREVKSTEENLFADIIPSKTLKEKQIAKKVDEFAEEMNEAKRTGVVPPIKEPREEYEARVAWHKDIIEEAKKSGDLKRLAEAKKSLKNLNKYFVPEEETTPAKVVSIKEKSKIDQQAESKLEKNGGADDELYKGYYPPEKLAKRNVTKPSEIGYRPAVRIDNKVFFAEKGIHVDAFDVALKKLGETPETFDYDRVNGSGGIAPNGHYYEDDFVGDVPSNNEEYKKLSSDELPKLPQTGKSLAKEFDLKYLGETNGFEQFGMKVKKGNKEVETTIATKGVDRKRLKDVIKKTKEKFEGKEVVKSREDRFEALADAQRGKPESAMVAVQHKIGGGILNPVVENAGDLTHRMAQSPSFFKGGFEWVKPKVDSVYRYLNQEYGFEKEYKENIRNNAKAKGVSLEEYQKELDKALSKYADEHSKLETYNEAQTTARDLAIAIGKQNWNEARKLVAKLKEHTDQGEKHWQEYALKDSTEVPTKKASIKKAQKGMPLFNVKIETKEQAKTLKTSSWVVMNALKKAGASEEVLSKLRVELKPIINMQSGNLEKLRKDHGLKANQKVELNDILGATTVGKYNALIELATSNQDLKSLEKVAYHEMFHLVSDWVLPKEDYNTVINHYKTEEKAADAFADFTYKKNNPPKKVNKIFQFLIDLFKVIRNKLRSKGYKSAQDVFGKIRKGEYEPHFGKFSKMNWGDFVKDLTEKSKKGSVKEKKVTELVTKPVRDFRRKLQDDISSRVEKALDKIDSYENWKFEIGDKVVGSVPGKMYRITNKTWSKRGGYGYVYETLDGEEKGVFSINRGANKSLLKVSGPEKIVKASIKKESQIKKMLEPVGEIAAEFKKSLGRTAKLADYYLGALSTRAENIDPSIKNVLLEYELDYNTKVEDIIKHVLPLIKATKKMSKEDYKTFDLARKNSDTETINKMLDKYEDIGLKKHYKHWRLLDDALIEQARNAGFKVNYLKEHNPREVRDFEGLMDHLHKTGKLTTVDLFIRQKEKRLGRPMTRNEKIELVNSIFRGYADERITLSKPGQLKIRKLRKITPELDKFFGDSNSAMLRYISDVVSAIEARKIFGKGVNKDSNIYNLDNTFGAYILDLSKKKRLTPSQELELRSILKARFNPAGTKGIVTTFKNLAIIDVMGSPASAIKQVGDIGWALIESGMVSSGKVLPRAVGGKHVPYLLPWFTREHLGISKIGAEFSDKTKSAKAVDATFKAVGLTRIDSIGKEILINSAYYNAVKKARSTNPKVVDSLRKELKPIFGNRTEALIEDFKNARDTRDARLFMLRKLSEYQPATMSELPQGFIEGGNARIFYMLKSFDLKKFDVYRRKVFRQIATKGQRARGIRNLFKIAFFLTAMEATGDMLIDLFLGRPIDFSDVFLARLSQFLVSRYTTMRIKREGVGKALLEQAIPPTQLADSLTKDIINAGDDKGLYSTKSIPVVGKWYYYRFGRGSKKIEKEKAKSENAIRRVQVKRAGAKRAKVNRNAIRARRVRPSQ